MFGVNLVSLGATIGLAACVLVYSYGAYLLGIGGCP